MYQTKKFSDLEFGEKFEVYGDIHLNYNYPAICKCIKVDDVTGQEIDGIRFCMGGNDEVSVLISNKSENVIQSVQGADMESKNIKENMDNLTEELVAVQKNSGYLSSAIKGLMDYTGNAKIYKQEKKNNADALASFQGVIDFFNGQHAENEKEFTRIRKEIKILQDICPHEAWSYSGRDSHKSYERCDFCRIERES